jgi:uncharacterized protein
MCQADRGTGAHPTTVGTGGPRSSGIRLLACREHRASDDGDPRLAGITRKEGAVLNRLVARVHRVINRKDLDAWMGYWADDAVFEFPGRTPISGRFVGKPSIEAWWRRFFDRMATIRFTPKRVAVANPLALVLGSTTMFAEIEVEVTSKDGVRSRAELVTVTRLRHGKAVFVRDYFFDPTVEEAIWGTSPHAGIHEQP